MHTPADAQAQEFLSQTLAFCDECLSRQDYPGAWQALCQAVCLAPNRADILSHRGRLALFLKDPDTAQRDFAAALKIDARCSAALSGLARYHLLQGAVAEAEAAADRSLGVDPADQEATQVKTEVLTKLSCRAHESNLPSVEGIRAERDSARAERDAARAERDALRQTICGPFSTEITSDTVRFDARLPRVPDREGNPISHPPELLFAPCLFRPLNVRIDPVLARYPRLNILLPSTSNAHNSGGPNTAYILAAELARCGIPIRIVAVNLPADPDSSAIRAHIARISGVSSQVIARIEFADGHNRGSALALGENDVFFATAWWTAQMVKYLLPRFRNRRFIYLIQDYEPNLHTISTNSVLALETYALNHFPVVNSRLLFDHFIADRVGRFSDPDFAREACWFEPSVDRTLYHPAESAPLAGRKRRLLFYARPDAPRNLLELGVAALMRLIEEGTLKPKEWDFHATVTGIGGSCRPVQLSTDGLATLVPLPLRELSAWATEMRRTDVLLSLIWSPHTSYPPLEGAASGALVVTNTCGVKTAARLRELSANIIAGASTIEGIAEALATAAGRSEDWAGRLAGARMGLPATWTQSFEHLLPRLGDFLGAAGIFSKP